MYCPIRIISTTRTRHFLFHCPPVQQLCKRSTPTLTSFPSRRVMSTEICANSATTTTTKNENNNNSDIIMRFGKNSWKDFTHEEQQVIQKEREENEIKLKELLSKFPIDKFEYGKICPACAKPNNKDTPFCTGCGYGLTPNDLQKLPDNVFMDIITGVNKDTQILYQDETVLLFNDKFGVSVHGEHIDVIPRHVIEDITKLTREDIPLIKRLYDTGLKNLESRGFCDRMGIPKDELPNWITAGYNYPVSVKHLHLHMVLPPFKHEKVFTYPRWHSHNKVLSDLEKHGRVIVYEEEPNDSEGQSEYDRAISNHHKAQQHTNGSN